MSMLISIIHPENNASQHVATKIGMKFLKQAYFRSVLVDIFCISTVRREK